ncbi:50S ribosomal protein L24 [Microgenomates bacterium UTCPR1]|nr:MAG: 50S ribosomal protein L24 [Microgenomates bacterium UTCPR1]
MKIKKGDKIKVISGKDKGRDGVVERVYKKSEKILVQGINIFKKHLKKSEQSPQGGIADVPRPILASKVALICSKCGKPTRVGFRVEKDKKFRICKKCKSKI